MAPPLLPRRGDSTGGRSRSGARRKISESAAWSPTRAPPWCPGVKVESPCSFCNDSLQRCSRDFTGAAGRRNEDGAPKKPFWSLVTSPGSPGLRLGPPGELALFYWRAGIGLEPQSLFWRPWGRTGRPGSRTILVSSSLPPRAALRGDGTKRRPWSGCAPESDSPGCFAPALPSRAWAAEARVLNASRWSDSSYLM
jgi:hypothetical protein